MIQPREEHPEEPRVRNALKALLREKGITYVECAESMGITKNGVAAILNGRQHLRYVHILRFLEVAGTSPGDFFSGLYTRRQTLLAGVAEDELRDLIRTVVREETASSEETTDRDRKTG